MTYGIPGAAELAATVVCEDCGCLVLDTHRHDKFHALLTEFEEVLRTLASIAPSVRPISVLGGPTREMLDQASAFARRGAST